MKVKLLFALVWICLLSACKEEKNIPNTDIDVARTFIKAILDNNFKDAEPFVLKEEMNNQYFKDFKKHFESKSKEELEKYRNADIIINEVSQVNDSVTVINYSNSYLKDKSNKLKLIRVNGQWQVDLKYTFSGNL